MVKYTRVPDWIRDKYITWKSDTTYGRKHWIEEAQNSEEIYYNDVDQTGTTYTSIQKSKIENSTNIPVSINFLHPIVNQKLAILTQTKPSTKTMSLDGRTKDEAVILDKMKDGLFNTTNAKMEIENHIKDTLITGIGHLFITQGNFYQPGLFNLQIQHIPWDEVILDINAKRRDLDDMEGFFIERQFTVPKALQLYQTIFSQIKDETGNPVDINSFTGITWVEQEITDKASVTTDNWNSDDRIVIREYYEKVYTAMYMIRNPKTNLLEPVFAEDLDEQSQAILKSAEKIIPDIYIKRTLMAGDYIIYENILPINDYPLVTSFFEWGGRPYRSYGMVHFTKDMQKASDKILQIMILNGILSNNAGWTAPKGSIAEEDRKKWEDFGNNPNVIKEYIAQDVGGTLLKPEKENVNQLSNFYPMVLEMMKSGMEYSTGINAVLQGNPKEAKIDVFSSLQQYNNAAMQRILLSSNHINDTMKNVGEVLVQYLSVSVTPNTFQFFDENGNLNELQIAMEMANKIRSARYMVVSIPATYMPSQRLDTAINLMKIAQSSPDPAERSILTQKAMQLTEVKGYDDILKQLDITKRTQGQLQQLQEAYKRLEETSKQMENRYINIAIENKVLKRLAAGEHELIKNIESAKADIEVSKEKMKNQAINNSTSK